MKKLRFLAACAARWANILVCTSMLCGADPLKPLRVIQVEHAAESQVDENPQLQEPHWVIRHSAGLKIVNVNSGNATDVLTRPWSNRVHDHNPSLRLLTPDATVFAYQPLDSGGEPLPSELIVARTRDGATIAKLDLGKLTGALGSLPLYTHLADDASCLWTLARTAVRGTEESRIVRIDLAPEPRVGASVQLKGGRKDAFHLFASGADPALVVVTTSSPQGGWFRIFDRDLELQDERRLPPAVTYFAANRPKPFVFVSFPAASSWQIFGQQEKGFRVVSQATVGSPRPRWHLGETLLHAAAVSPDGNLLVTSRVSERPTISIWNPANGKLVREFQVQGGSGYKLNVPSHHTLFRFAFSKSGKYLTAADPMNVYLVDAADLVKASTATEQ